MVRPVELQDAFGKTPAVEKIVEAQKANPENEQRANLVSAERKSAEEERKAIPAQHSDEVILHKEKPDEDKQKRQNKQSGETDEEPHDESDSHDEPLAPPSLDITV